MTTHVSQAKKDVVASLLKDIEQFKIVGAVNLEGFPSLALQKMRTSLRKDGVKIVMTKRRLIKVALEQSKRKGMSDLVPFLKGMPALIFAKDNPFKLFKTLERSKSPAPAKAGQIAPKDILVPAGPTAFAPGPIIGELGSVGIKAGINAGKVEIKMDATVLKEGQPFTDKLAGILTRLAIFPMEIGLNLTGAFEDGLVYDKKVLAVDEKAFIENITLAATWALNLSVEASITNKDNIEILIGKAATETRNLALDATIYADEVMDLVISNAHAHMLGVASGLPADALGDELQKQQAAPAQAAAAQEPASEDKAEGPKQEEEKKNDESAAAGLGALFG